MTDELRLKIENLPDSPGCYLMKQQGEIIYVGKAVNLKNRVRSYFQNSRGHTPKVAAMVGKIDDFDIMLCSTNLEALILECNLIKRHKPYYNILLKDDKHYPYVRVDMQKPFPRLEVARRIGKDGAKYFGPYIGATVVRQVMDAVQNIFPLRSCTLDLPLKSPRRPCVQYEIGRCLAPCANKCTQEEYGAMMEQVLAFLGGRYQDVVTRMKADMEAASKELHFERAAYLRDKIRDVEILMERQRAIQVSGADQDILAIAQDGLDAMVQVLYVRGGRMIGGDQFVLPQAGSDIKGEVLAAFLTQYYEDGNLIPRQVLCQELPDDREELESWLRDIRGSAVTLTTPKRGEKHDLVMLAEKNAQDALEKRNARSAIREERTTGAAAALGEALGLEKAPRRIEGYDISNTQGVLSVASMVVFIDGEPAKKEYRHFRIKTVEGPNDFASMNEVVGRRFRHGLEEQKEREEAGQPMEGGKFSDMPDLVLIDGGPEQLAFALRAMHEAGANVPMFGLAKRLEEIYLPDRELPILLDRRSPALHLIQRIRDEAHRFAITHHRNLRGKESVHSQIEDIPGIGPARRKALLKQFHSLQAVLKASLDELLAVPGMTRPAAEAVISWAAEKKA
jgi:excinuclease ABC subunit C